MGARQGSRRCLPLLAALLVALLLTVALTACGSSTGGAANNGSGPAAKQGGTYDYPLASDPGFDPSIAQYGDGGLAVLHELYEGLARWELQPDGTMKTVPCLAESWSANADATVWTVKLRRGVIFQAPVSREVIAADVVADLRYIADPAHHCEVAYYLAPIKGADQNGNASPGSLGVEALDRYSVRFTLQNPFSEFPDTLGGQAFWVWPVDYLREVGLKAYGQHPVGTGPYQFLRRVPGTSIDLVRNPHWWDTSGGPYIDTIHYEVFGNVPAMALAFQKGTVDWTTVPVGQVAASRSLPQVKSGQWKVVITPQLAIRYMWVNMKDPLLGGTQGLPLRQALTYGYDRQAAIDAASGGVFLPPSTGVVPPGVPGAQYVKVPYPYDPAKAKELMQGIGPVTLELAYPVAQQQLGSVRSLISSYAKIGITIKAKGIGFDRYGDYIYGGKAQLYFGGMFADYPTMGNFLDTLFQSSIDSYGTGYANPKVDALLAKARTTTDPQARVQQYCEAERLILADAPAMPLYDFADARLLNSRVANVRFNSMFCADLWRAWVK